MLSNHIRGFCGVWMTLIIALLAEQTITHADAVDAARWFPQDSFLFLHAGSVDTLRQKFKQTSMYGLYQDPAMQEFVVPAEKKLRAKFDEMMKEEWQEIGLDEPPQQLPIPEGQIAAALFIQPRAFDNTLPEMLQPDFQVIVLAEMGSKTESARELAAKITAKAVEKGLIRQRETVRGVEIDIIKENPQADENYDTFCFGFKDNWLIAGSSLSYIRQVLMRMEGDELASLADQRDFVETCRTLAAADIFYYANAQPLISVIKTCAPAEEQPQIPQIIEALGVANVTGLGVAMELVPNPTEDLRIKALLGVRGEKTGVPALLTPVSTDIRPNRLLTKHLAGFVVANYQVSRIYDEIVRIVWAIGQVNLDGMLKGALMMTGQPGEGQRPPVDFRQEVLGQLDMPITVTTRLEKPFTDPGSSKSLFAMAVRNGEILDTALARLHSTFLAQGNPQMQRELLDCTIYLLPPMPFMPVSFMMNDSFPAEPSAASQLAIAVAADQLVIGSVDVVEQAIRDLRAENLESIMSDPMYQYARQYLPAQAGVYFYQNDQMGDEMLWSLLKETARQMAQQDFSSPDEDANVPGLSLDSSPYGFWLDQTKDYFDFNALPDYARVKKYFGATVGHVVGNEQGIYAQTVTLTAPAAAP